MAARGALVGPVALLAARVAAAGPAVAEAVLGAQLLPVRLLLLPPRRQLRRQCRGGGGVGWTALLALLRVVLVAKTRLRAASPARS